MLMLQGGLILFILSFLLQSSINQRIFNNQRIWVERLSIQPDLASSFYFFSYPILEKKTPKLFFCISYVLTHLIVLSHFSLSLLSCTRTYRNRLWHVLGNGNKMSGSKRRTRKKRTSEIRKRERRWRGPFHLFDLPVLHHKKMPKTCYSQTIIPCVRTSNLTTMEKEKGQRPSS